MRILKYLIVVCIYLTVYVACDPLLLTPLIERGEIAKAREASKINVDDVFAGHSGYFTVPSRMPSKQSNNVFTWLQPCTNGCNPVTAPFVLWLQGGPGGPGTFGALSEIGNFYVGKNMKLKKRCFSWCENHNCLFVDQPTMTGLSFPVNSSGVFDKDNVIYTETSAEAMEQIYQVVQQVFTLFPEYQSAPFYVAGESYGGLYCAHMAYTIWTHNQNNDNVTINLKSVLVGDPMINADYQFPTYPHTLHGMGLIMEDERDRLVEVFKEAAAVVDTNCTAGFNLWNSVWNDDGGGGSPGLYWQMTGSSNTENGLLPGEPAGFDRYGHYFDPIKVQEAFHFEGSPAHSSTEGGEVYHTMVKSGDWCSNSSWIYATLFLNGIDVLIYSSTVDPLLGPPTTEAGIQAIWDYAATKSGGDVAKKAYEKAPKVIWKVDDKDDVVAGYAKCFTNSKGTNFCYTVVRNAGHESPGYQPRSNYDMFLRFINHRAFSKDGNDPSTIPDCPPCGGLAPFAGLSIPACQE